MGKLIYKPKGKAGEYSEWAANLYKGCSNRCSYCYLRKGILASVLGGDTPTMKCAFSTEDELLSEFSKELKRYRKEIFDEGGELFFSFTTDPFLPETIGTHVKAFRMCIENGIKVVTLTKMSEFVHDERFARIASEYPHMISVGFTLTGKDDAEPNADSNLSRIEAMKRVKSEYGCKTWASVEPILSPESSMEMISLSFPYCDKYKIGILSGKKCYSPEDIRIMYDNVNTLTTSAVQKNGNCPKEIYWKQSLLKFIGLAP